MIRLRVQIADACVEAECDSVDEAAALLCGIAEGREAHGAAQQGGALAVGRAPEPRAATKKTPEEQPSPRQEPSTSVEIRSNPSRPAPETKPDDTPQNKFVHGRNYDAAAFERAWNASQNCAEVAAKTGITVAAAQMRATKLRREGRALKRFKRGGRKRVVAEASEPAVETIETTDLRFDEATRTLHFPDGATKQFGSIAAGRAYAEAEAEKLGLDLTVADEEDDD